jgi:hypothetical protein
VAPELPPGLVAPQPQQSALTLTRLAEKAPTQLSFIDEEDKSPMKADIITPATTAGGCADFPSTISSAASTPLAQSEDPASPEMCESADPLPSIGSAQHASGECRRCNFFAKGRCQNGKDCAFCHLPHDRRKPSRQERREQKAARLAQQDAQSEDGVSDDGEKATYGGDLSPIAATPQSKSTAKAGLGSPPVERQLSELTVCPPPGLSPPSHVATLRREVSPLAAMAIAQIQAGWVSSSSTRTIGTQTDQPYKCSHCPAVHCD